MTENKIKAEKVHDSKLLEQTRTEAFMTVLREQAEKMHYSPAVLAFDNELYLLILKYLQKVPREELEKVYHEKTVIEAVEAILDLEKKWPERSTLSSYVC